MKKIVNISLSVMIQILSYLIRLSFNNRHKKLGSFSLLVLRSCAKIIKFFRFRDLNENMKFVAAPLILINYFMLIEAFKAVLNKFKKFKIMSCQLDRMIKADRCLLHHIRFSQSKSEPKSDYIYHIST